jgi:hypothetical protein
LLQYLRDEAPTCKHEDWPPSTDYRKAPYIARYGEAMVCFNSCVMKQLPVNMRIGVLKQQPTWPQLDVLVSWCTCFVNCRGHCCMDERRRALLWMNDGYIARAWLQAAGGSNWFEAGQLVTHQISWIGTNHWTKIPMSL